MFQLFAHRMFKYLMSKSMK